ncbi:hypothetical protein PRZ48_007714 [Zasmidium cellare]|uniref:Amidohydrolase-related domain-containing protein n=1 Tax=Zasmidium cellare TaxID=395010 RepID=A0ABR0EK56_ZASCE|nr:hypothetical protein PRZ48_007714 [Zasmidium cellare]
MASRDVTSAEHIERSEGENSLPNDLKIIVVEEHTLAPPHLTAKFPTSDPTIQLAAWHAKTTLDYPGFKEYGVPRLMGKIPRLEDMDQDGIAVQVLSRAASMNTGSMEGEAATALCRELNDAMAKQRDVDPARFKALCELPWQAPKLAAQELRRCVQQMGFVGAMLHGSVGGRFLDDPEFDEPLSAFEELDVPLYLHPGVPPKAVIDAYYTMPGKNGITAMLASAGWGWHSEVAIHVLRLATSGTLDRHQKLKIVVGHQGEMLPIMMERLGEMFHPEAFGFKRTVPEMLRSQVWIAISGMFSVQVTELSVKAFGADRVLFAVDYPMISSEGVTEFLKELSQALPPEVLRKICQTNSEELFKVKA